MLRNLCPHLFVPSIMDLDLGVLKGRGIKALILDLDNTLVEWGKTHLRPEMIQWVESLKSEGFKLCILSNAMPGRVAVVARKLGIPGISRAIKPRRGAFRKALDRLGVECGEAAVIGDQLFTDVLGGNRCCLFTVLTPPISEKEFVYTRLVRKVERMVLRHLKRTGILP